MNKAHKRQNTARITHPSCTIRDSKFHSFLSHNGPFSRHFGILHGPKHAISGSKQAKNPCLSPGSLSEKCVFHQILTHCWCWTGPFSRHFGIFHGPKRGTTGSKWAKNTCLSTPNGPGSLLGKHIFDPFLSHIWFQNGPFSRHFEIFCGPKRATTGSKRAKNTCLSIPSGLGTTLKKIIFFAPGTPLDPPLPPTARGLCCPPATQSDHWCEGVGISLGDSEAWKPQKVGGCGWNGCPQKLVWSQVTQDTARSWFWLCWTQIMHG